MSGKTPTIEEKLSQSIFYNLSILKLAVKATPDFEESLSPVRFEFYLGKQIVIINFFSRRCSSSPTQKPSSTLPTSCLTSSIRRSLRLNFIGRFPKRKLRILTGERCAIESIYFNTNNSSFRSSAVDFINIIIDKYHLAQEKVKLVFVVHPGGRKFILLILDLVMIAIKEIMKRRKFAPGKSFNMKTVMVACSNMKEVETCLVNSIKTETKIVKERTLAIQKLVDSIYPHGEFPMTFEEFIEAWHAHNEEQLIAIKGRTAAMEEIYCQAEDLFNRAQQLLSAKTFEAIATPLKDIQDIAEFYANAGVADDIPQPIADGKLNFPWLVAQLHLVLPTIVTYVENFRFEPSDTNNDELKVLQRLSRELDKIETNVDEFAVKFNEVITALIAKLKQKKEERELDQTVEKTPEQEAKEILERENLKLLVSPKYYFDASKECLKHVMVKKNRLALMDDEEQKENLANETKFYRAPKSPYVKKLNQSKIVNEMRPPKPQPRRRFNAMELLNEATAGAKNRRDMNSSIRYTGAVPKQAQVDNMRFSSTLLSPYFNHPPAFNISTLSEISEVTLAAPETPLIAAQPFTLETPIDWNNIQSSNAEVLKTIQKSPKGGLRSLLTADEIFNNHPKVQLNDETMKNEISAAQGSGSSSDTSDQTTMRIKSSNDSENNSYSLKSIRLQTDEDLFNVSDSILRDIDD